MTAQVARVEQLLAAVEDDTAAIEAIRAVVELYGEALRRVVEFGPPRELLEDELISHLLLVHDLHPVPVEERVARALEEVRPYLGSHGGDVELVAVEGVTARVRLQGTCDGCASSTATLTHAITQAVLAAAPELEAVEAEPATRLVQIGSLSCPTELASR